MSAKANIVENLRHRIDGIPRVVLGSLPTPLQEAPRLADRLGVRRLFVKRDDLTGLGLGGNKVRTLEYTVAEAVAAGADLLLGAAYVHSNHCRQVAAAGARLGIEVRLLLRRAGDQPVSWQGNLLLDELFGAGIEFVEAPDTFALLELARGRVGELEASGRRPALLTLTPASRLLGAIAAMRTLLEVEGQLRAAGEAHCSVYVSSGGPTYAGLLSAARLIGADLEIRGISHQFDTATQAGIVTQLLTGIESLLELVVPPVTPDIEIDDRFIGPGYGLPSAAALDAIRIAASLDGLVLDPIYTGKAMAGLLGHAREGRLRPDEVIVFHHTGGIPAVFTFAGQLHDQPIHASG
ncbi:MAG: pyridoxal-phosphate dependent enzyme [Candidatus Limnocylindrales bacterium]